MDTDNGNTPVNDSQGPSEDVPSTPAPLKRPYRTNRWSLSSQSTRWSQSPHLSPPDNLHLLESLDIASFSPEHSTLDSPSILSTQPRLRPPKRSNFDKAHGILVVIQKEFRSLGAFLDVVFHVREHRSQDLRTATHRSMVTAFLKGESTVQVSHIIDAIYRHPEGRPNTDSEHAHEKNLSFSTTISPNDIHHARPSLSSWATQLVGNTVHYEIGRLTRNDPDDINDRTQLRASKNSRSKGADLATWDDLGKFSITSLAAKYKQRAPLAWYLTESMAAPKNKGVIAMRVRRPHTPV